MYSTTIMTNYYNYYCFTVDIAVTITIMIAVVTVTTVINVNTMVIFIVSVTIVSIIVVMTTRWSWSTNAFNGGEVPTTTPGGLLVAIAGPFEASMDVDHSGTVTEAEARQALKNKIPPVARQQKLGSFQNSSIKCWYFSDYCIWLSMCIPYMYSWTYSQLLWFLWYHCYWRLISVFVNASGLLGFNHTQPTLWQPLKQRCFES